MFAIISEGKVVGRTENPRYLKFGKFGEYLVEAKDPSVAIGVAFQGKAYNLNDGKDIPDAPNAIVREIDAGEVLFGEEETNAKNDDRISEIEAVLMDLDNADVIE